MVARFADNGWKVWDLVGRALMSDPGPVEAGNADGGRFFGFNPAGPTVFRQNAAGLRVYNAQTGQPIGPTIPNTAEATFPVWSRDGRRLAYAVMRPYGSYVSVVDPFQSRVVVPKIELPEVFNLYSLAFSNDGSMIAAGGGAGARGARVWDANTGAPVTDLLSHREVVYHIEFTPDDMNLVTTSGVPGTERGEINLFRVGPGSPRGLRLRQNATVFACDVSHDGTRLVACCVSEHGTRLTQGSYQPTREGGLKPGDQVRVWQVVKNGPKVSPLMHRSAVSTTAVTPDGSLAVTAGGTPSLWGKANTGAARVWDLATGRETGRVLRHPGAVTTARFSPDGRSLLTVGREGKARVWEIATGRPVGPDLDHPQAVSDANFSRDGRRVLAVGQTGPAAGIHLYQTDTEDLSPMAPLRPTDRAEPATVMVYDATTCAPVSPPLSHETEVVQAVFDPSGRFVSTVDFRDALRLWDVAKGSSVTPEWGRGQAVTGVEYAGDGSSVLVRYRDNSVRLWDPASGKPLIPPVAHNDNVLLALLDARAKRFLTAQDDGNVRVWGAATGTALTPDLNLAEPGSPGGETRVSDARFSDDAA